MAHLSGAEILHFEASARSAAGLKNRRLLRFDAALCPRCTNIGRALAATQKTLYSQVRPVGSNSGIARSALIARKPSTGIGSRRRRLIGDSGDILGRLADLPLRASQRVAPVRFPDQRARVGQFSGEALQPRRIRRQHPAPVSSRRADQHGGRADEQVSKLAGPFLIAQVGMSPQVSRDHARHAPRNHRADRDRAIFCAPIAAQSLGQRPYPQSRISQLPQPHYFGISHS